jgi:hypothetical protein
MIHITECNFTTKYQNNKLLSSIDLLLNIPQVRNRIKNSNASDCGEVLTSVGHDYSDLTELPGISTLMEWINQEILKTNQFAKDIQFTKSWCNKMYKGSEGLFHNHFYHEIKPDFVAIFYIQAEGDCANLVFYQDAKLHSHYYDYDENKMVKICSKSGMLVVHSPEIPHAVTEHKSDIPRICLVFEGKYI